MHVSLLLRLAGIYADSTSSTHSLTPRSIPLLTVHSIHPLYQPIFQFAPHLHPQFPRAIKVHVQVSRGEESLHEGLVSVLDRFSEGLRARKILPSLLEEVGRSPILEHGEGFILFADERPAPTTINPSQYLRDVHQPPPFAIRFASAPVVAGALRHQGTTAEYHSCPYLLHEKCDNAGFWEHDLPLVYNAQDSEHAGVSTHGLEDFA